MLLVATIASPILAFLGAYVGHRKASRADDRLDRWRRREETMRMLRWAVERGGSSEPFVWQSAVATLEGLLVSELLQDEDLRLVRRLASIVFHRDATYIEDRGQRDDDHDR